MTPAQASRRFGEQAVKESTIDVGRIRWRARNLSKVLLGGQFRAEIATCIATGEEPFWARNMARQLDIPENKVSTELVRFADGGLLVVLEPAAWDRRKLYQRARESTYYWELGFELVRRAASDEALRAGLASSDAIDAYLASLRGTSTHGRDVTVARD